MADARQVADDVEAVLDQVYQHVDALKSTVSSAVSSAVSAGGRQLPRDRLTEVEAVVADMVADVPWVGGGGFVAALDTVDQEHRFWEWWTRGNAGIERLHPPRSSSDGAEYAYEVMQWFRDGQAGRASVFGPFVDFAGVNQLVILCAEPVVVGEQFLGVVGADLVVDLFEIQMVRRLRILAEQVVLTGSTGRVVASNTASYAPGERFASAGWIATGVDADRARWSLWAQDRDQVSPLARR